MPRSKTVTLAGQEYIIEQLAMRPNKEWRDALGAPVMQLIQLVESFGDLEFKASDVTKIVGVVKDLLLDSMDTLLDALFAYCPALAQDRERIESEAYDDEAIAALGVVVSLAYPLDRLWISALGWRGDADYYELALAEWGQWDSAARGGPPEAYKEDLIDSYMHRQQWLQRNQAAQVINLYAEAMGGSRKSTQPRAAAKQEAPRRKPILSADEFLKKNEA